MCQISTWKALFENVQELFGLFGFFQGSQLSGIKADFASDWLQKPCPWLKAPSVSNCKSLVQRQTASSPQHM